MSTKTDFKTKLLKEIRHEDWRETIADEEYDKTCKALDEFKEKNLAIIRRKNKGYKRRLKTAIEAPPAKKPQRVVSLQAQEAYNEWSTKFKKKSCPKVPVRKLLVLLYYLESESAPTQRTALDECIRKQQSEFEVFWDSSSVILKALRHCVLRRDWPNLVHFLLILLNYDGKYISIIKTFCKVLVRNFPLVKRSGLADQFTVLLEKPSNTNLEVV